MKVIKKITAIMLSIMMVLGMSSVISAAGNTSGMSPTVRGKITINNAVSGQTYNIYKILDLESYNATTENYAYKAATKWDTFITSGGGEAYLTKDPTSGYVTWKNGVRATESDAAAFAKIALTYAKDLNHSIAPDKTSNDATWTTTSTVVFDDLDLGYYLIDSSVGTLCYLNTTNSEVTIKEKNGVPSVKKEVQEDSKINQPNEYGKKNTADIGQTVNFKTTITAQAGAQKYVLHDKMSEGLTFNNNSVKIVKKAKTGGTESPLTENTEYTLNTSGTESVNPKCTFEVEFKQDFCDTLANDDQIIITYSATLNKNAVVAGVGNTNKTWLNYGDSSKTSEDTTTTYTYKIPVFKYTDVNTPLAGATFKLTRDNSSTAEAIKFVKKASITDDIYQVTMNDDSNTVTTITTQSSGKFTIEGLDAGTYYLTETQQPAGYNKLKDPLVIVIDDENGDITVGTGTDAKKVDEVKVLNQSGSILPSTGGMGTTLFYIFGGILVIGSGVVLITKKRMK